MRPGWKFQKLIDVLLLQIAGFNEVFGFQTERRILAGCFWKNPNQLILTEEKATKYFDRIRNGKTLVLGRTNFELKRI